MLNTPFAFALALVALLVIAFTPVPFPMILLGAALAGLAARRWRPGWLAEAAPDSSGPGGIVLPSGGVSHAVRVGTASLMLWWLPLLGVGFWLGFDSTAGAMGLFFSKAALVTFGGAYAVLPYVAEQAVQRHGWLDAEQMMAGLGLAETTPGPLVLVLEFVGFVGGWQRPDLGSPLASALLCTAVTLWATFLPCFLFVLTCAPWIDRIGRSRLASAALAAITAAVVGVIAHLALWFGGSLLAAQAWPAAVLAAAIAAVVYVGLSRWNWPVAVTVPGAGVVGALAQFVLPIVA